MLAKQLQKSAGKPEVNQRWPWLRLDKAGGRLSPLTLALRSGDAAPSGSARDGKMGEAGNEVTASSPCEVKTVEKPVPLTSP